MTNRNPQINYKQGSLRSVEIKFPSCEVLFKKLVLDFNTFEFVKIFKKKSKHELDVLDEYEKDEYLKSLPVLHDDAINRKLKRLKAKEIITNQEDLDLENRLKLFHKREISSIEEKGVNILYICFGLLKWYDIGKKNPNYSPLIYIPVDVYRKSILLNYKIKILDDTILINTSLKQKFSEVYQINIPKFEDDFTTASLTNYFNKFRSIISKKNEWEIQERSFIGLFSFSKISLFQDLENHHLEFFNHDIVRSIAEGKAITTSIDIPRDKVLGDNLDPINNYSVLDSDSSQDKVIQYSKNGISMVVRGPPGTGKSQTISNIIAECLSQDKKVLFVAEKMAALNVVKKRLDEHGIGEFCLEVHSHKSNKAQVLDQIRSSLSKNLVKQNFPHSKLNSLKTTRNKLNNYVKDINKLRGGAEQSLFHQIGMISKMDETPLIRARINDVLKLNGEEIFELKEKFSELERYKPYLNGLDNNPFKDFIFNNYSSINEDHVFTYLEDILDILYEFLSIKEQHGFYDKFKNIDNIENYLSLKNYFENYHILSITLDIKNKLLEYKNKYSSFTRYLKRAYYRFRKEILSNTIKPMKIDQILQEIDFFHSNFLFSEHKINLKTLEFELQEANAQFQLLNQSLSLVTSTLNLKKSPLDGKIFKDLSSYLENLIDQAEEFASWVSYNYLINFINQKIGKGFIKKLKEKDYDDVLFEKLFEKSYLTSWIRNATNKSSEIKNFEDKSHERSINKFIELDQSSISLNQYRISEILFNRRDSNSVMSQAIETSEMGYLNRELQKKRKIRPLRKLFTITRHYLTTIKPCFLMSPLSVSNYLPGHIFENFFDVVIFDEASQIPPEDAIGSILRGKQLIVVGDQKQMPPTNFFKVALSEEFEDEDNYSLESILDECVGIGLTELSLNWHYRSKKEGLIQFSNYHYYENNLVTFPDILKDPDSEADNIDMLPAVDFVYVENGIYDKGKTRQNRIEAKKVALGIVQHYKKNKINGTDFSLGVVAFSEAQANAIEEELEKLYKLHPEYEELVMDSEINKEGLFIKNLENVQGDERDFIFFSICYGKDVNGKMTLNFGPINRIGGERRLNVLITRARYHVKAYCSFNPGEIDISKSKSVGFKHLIQYLKFTKIKKLGEMSRSKKSSQIIIENPFEKDVEFELIKRGYEVDTKVGTAGYRIDIAIVNPKNPAKYILGLECDGASYNNSNTARDRDRIRKQVLNSLGWEIFHIWSPKWYSSKEKVLKDIASKIKSINNQKNKSNLINKQVSSIKSKIKYEKNDWKPDKISKKVKNDPEYRKRLLNIENVVEYTPFHLKEVSFRDNIYNTNVLSNAINKILHHEGPIHREILENRLIAYFGFKRKSPNLKQYLNRIIPEKYYFPKSFNNEQLRIFVDPTHDKRKAHQLVPYEIKNSFQIILNEIKGITKSELFQKSASLFGIKVVNNYLEKTLEIAFNELIKDKQIYFENEIVRAYT